MKKQRNTFSKYGISAVPRLYNRFPQAKSYLPADRMPAKRLVLWSLIIYPLVGISYFLAGLWGMAIFIVIARVINGFNWELENVGIDTYYRRVINSKVIASSFGYLETWSHVAWITGALIGMVLVLFMPIHYLLLGIAPFAVIAYFVALRAPTSQHDIMTP